MQYNFNEVITMEANDVKKAADVITADTNIIEAVQAHPEIMYILR